MTRYFQSFRLTAQTLTQANLFTDLATIDISNSLVNYAELEGVKQTSLRVYRSINISNSPVDCSDLALQRSR